jgi:hypothetical protein
VLHVRLEVGGEPEGMQECISADRRATISSSVVGLSVRAARVVLASRGVQEGQEVDPGRAPPDADLA